MKLKFYAIVPNVEVAIDYYSKVFDIDVIKGSQSWNHGNIKLFGEISILLAPGDEGPKLGRHIIKFEPGERSVFLKAVEKIRNSSLVTITSDDYNASWGTTIFQFIDRLGYTWVLEINTEALNS